MYDSSCLQTFSTDDIPDRDRIPLWRDHFGRSVVKADFVPVEDVAFRCTSAIRDLPDLKIWSCTITKSEVERTRSLAADGDDSLVLGIMKKGHALAMQSSRDAGFGNGEALLWAADIPATYRNLTAADIITLAFPRRSLTSALSDPDKALLTTIPSSNEALRHLIRYTDLLNADAGPMTPALQVLSSAHIRDLVLLALGATRDATEIANARGLRAARLQAIKRDIMTHLSEQALSVDYIASRHAISPRYIRSLFEGDQTTFTDFVREQRLRVAHRMLADPSLAQRSISTIAFDVGFGDISHFNQMFRQRFGATPSDVRAFGRNRSAEGT